MDWRELGVRVKMFQIAILGHPHEFYFANFLSYDVHCICTHFVKVQIKIYFS